MSFSMICTVITVCFGSGVLTMIGRYFFKKIKAIEDRNEAIALGVQALLRDKLLEKYDKYHEGKGYAPIYAKDNFDNMYQQYHKLGENGVMDEKHIEFMHLPDRRLENENQNRCNH